MAQGLVKIRPLHNRVLVGIYDDGDTTIMLGGKKFYTLDDTNFDDKITRNKTTEKHKGIRDRWGVVMAVGNGQVDVTPGDKVLLKFGEWTRGIKVNLDGHTTKLWSIPGEEIMGIESDDFTDVEKEQIERLYPDFETWKLQEF